ncbi:MAG: OmpA family protein [Planctomycetes bacterium]|nr:OmpA family protein [Planctomycetota bacterium]
MTATRSGWLRALGATALVTMATLTGGCQQTRLSEEREALYGQNKELQGELNKTRSALEAAEAERQRQAAENARIQAELEEARNRQNAAVAVPISGSGGGASAGATSLSNVGGGAEVTEDAEKITVRLPGDVLFASGKADLTPSARKTLASIARILNGEEKGHRIRVEGHTDTDPIKHSKWKSNQELSEARASAVSRYLHEQAVASSRLSTKGYGSTQPRESKAKSRRVEIIILKKS